MKNRFKKKNSMAVWVGLSGASAVALMMSGCSGASTPRAGSEVPRVEVESPNSGEGGADSVTSFRGGVMGSEREIRALVSPELIEWTNLLRSPVSASRLSPESYRWAKAFVREEWVRVGAEKSFDGGREFDLALAATAPALDKEGVRAAEGKSDLLQKLADRARSREWGSFVGTQSDLHGQLLRGSPGALPYKDIQSGALWDLSAFQNVRGVEADRHSAGVRVFREGMVSAAESYLSGMWQIMTEGEREQWRQIFQQSLNEKDFTRHALEQIEKFRKDSDDTANRQRRWDSALLEVSEKAENAFLAQELYQKVKSDPERAIQNLQSPEVREREQVDREIRESAQKLRLISMTFLVAEKKHWERVQKTIPEQKALEQKTQEMVSKARDEVVSTPGKFTSTREFTHEYLSGKKSSVQLLDQVRSQLTRSDLSPQEREQLEERKALLSSTLSLNRKMGEILDGAGALLEVGRSLGVDPKLLGKVSKGIQIGVVTQKVIDGFLTGGLSGVTSALSAIAGIGAPDLGAERHREVMAQFGALAQGQEAILKFNEAILEGQKVLFEQQKAVFDSVLKVSEQVATLQQSLTEQIEGVRLEVLLNRQLILDQLVAPLNACREFDLDSGPEKLRSIWSEERNAFTSHLDFVQYLESRGPELRACREGIFQFLDLKEKVPTYFAYESAITGLLPQDEGNVRFLVDEVYTRALRKYEAFKAKREGSGGLDEKMSPLFFPLEKADALDSFAAQLERGRGERSGDRVNGSDPSLKSKWMERLLSPDAIEKVALLALRLVPWLESVDPQNQSVMDLQSWMAALSQGRKVSRSGDFVQSALKLVSVGIAQQSLLAGVGIIPELYEEIMSGEVKHLTELSELLEKNPRLAKNFVLYAVSRNLRDRGQSLKVSEWARVDRSGHALRSGLTLPLEKELLPSQIWAFRFGNLRIPVPTFEEVSAARMSYPADLARLLDLRALLAGRVAEFEVREQSVKEGKGEEWMNFYRSL